MKEIPYINNILLNLSRLTASGSLPAGNELGSNGSSGPLYLQPDGSSLYFRPDGFSLYLQPEQPQ